MHKGILYIILAAFSLGFVALFFDRPVVLLLLLVLLLAILLVMDWSWKLAIFVLITGIAGAGAEAVGISHGAWAYAHPALRGVPLWLPVLWSIAALFIRKVGVLTGVLKA